MTFSADLDVWVPPGPPAKNLPYCDGSRDHQGPRKGTGPSCQRRREKRDAARYLSKEEVETEIYLSERPEKAYSENAGEAEILDKAEKVIKADTAEEAETAKRTVQARTSLNISP